MDAKRIPDPTGQGIELSTRPSFQEFQHPGIEVIEQPSLEVVPQQEIQQHQRHSVPWEKKASDYDYGPPPQTAHSTVAPPYGYPSPYERSFDQRPLMPPPPTAPEVQQERLILGLKRQTFFIILAIAIFLTVAGIAAGVGVGVALKGNDPPSSTTSPINTATRVFPLPTAQATTGPSADIKCPSNNLTSYTSQVDNKKQFTLLCGRDYASQQGSVDLFNQATETMSECIDLCAEQSDCVGVGWGFYHGSDVCWLKRRLAQPGWALAWYFAALDDVSGLALSSATPAPAPESKGST